MFLYEAERVVTDLMNLSDVARRLSGVGVEALIIGIGSGLAPVLLPRMFPPGSFPANLHLEIKTAPTRVIFDDLYDDRLDLGVVTEVAPDRVPSGLIGIPLFELDMELILPPAHKLAAKKGPLDIALLMEEPIIMNELSIGYGQIVLRLHVQRPRHAPAHPRHRRQCRDHQGDGADRRRHCRDPGRCRRHGSESLGLLAARPIAPARRITIMPIARVRRWRGARKCCWSR